jgi:hypothetical protein
VVGEGDDEEEKAVVDDPEAPDVPDAPPNGDPVRGCVAAGVGAAGRAGLGIEAAARAGAGVNDGLLAGIDGL